jgi:uncharacterized protein (TIGR02301 family)
MVLCAACIGLAPVAPIAAQQPQQQANTDDRPYDVRLLRLSEILGAIHYLRELCGADEGQRWRDQMREILRVEGTTAIRRARLVNGFNHGYRGYSRTYRTCTESARTAVARFMEEGTLLSQALVRENR